jgi:hypothetical protein
VKRTFKRATTATILIAVIIFVTVAMFLAAIIFASE